MRKTLAALCLVLSVSAANAGSWKKPAFRAQVPAVTKTPVQAEEPFQILDPKPRVLPPSHPFGAVVGKVSLPAQLDKHRDLLPGKQLGPKAWDISVAGNAGFKDFFLTFQNGGQLSISPLGDLNRLRGDGIDVTVEPGVVYNFKAKINIFSPVRGSTMEIHPSRGTRGAKHDIKTGKILDAMKAKSYVFSSNGKEYWLLHGTDVDAATNRPTTTKSLLFIHEDGLSTKAWPMAESSLPEGAPVAVSFGDAKLVLTRAASGELQIAKAN